MSIDLASFEVVENCFTELHSFLQQGSFDMVLCNEEEAAAIAKVDKASIISCVSVAGTMQPLAPMACCI